MEAKDKAHELVFDTFRKVLGISDWYIKNNPKDFKNCKKCALKLCDEILEVNEKGLNKKWTEIRLEIENLKINE